MRLLKDDRGSVRLAAVEALAAIGPDAASAAAAIQSLLENDKYAVVRDAAKLALAAVAAK
jgi:HEAT repeat protein